MGLDPDFTLTEKQCSKGGEGMGSENMNLMGTASFLIILVNNTRDC